MGHYGDFDRPIAGVAIKEKKIHLEVTLTLLMLYHLMEPPIPATAGVTESISL